jgi:hypothetical protein
MTCQRYRWVLDRDWQRHGTADPWLKDALLEIAGDRSGQINRKQLGNYLARHVRRIENGLRLEDAGRDSYTNRRTYCVARVTSVLPEPALATETN